MKGKQVLVLIVPQSRLNAEHKFCLRSVPWWVSHHSLNQLLVLQQQGHKLFVKRLLFLEVIREVLIFKQQRKGKAKPTSSFAACSSVLPFGFELFSFSVGSSSCDSSCHSISGSSHNSVSLAAFSLLPFCPLKPSSSTSSNSDNIVAALMISKYAVIVLLNFFCMAVISST